MNVVVAERDLGRAMVEVVDCGPRADFRYETWYRPRSNYSRPLLCSCRHYRSLAAADMCWVARKTDPYY